MSEELYRRYRPTSLKDVVGQEEAVKTLAALGKGGGIPHCLLFTGPSGTGKTTLGRIIRNRIGCSDIDFIEINAAEERGIDMVRDIARRVNSACLGGKSRVWLIDEAGALTADAQNAFLKHLEDIPPHVYFMLATTDPQKLKKTILTRCTEIKCKAINVANLIKMMENIIATENASGEQITIDDQVYEKIAEAAEGSARKALVLLNAVYRLPTTEQQLRGVDANDHKALAIEIAKALLDTRTTWADMRKILNGVSDEPEGIRHLVLAYANSALLRSDLPRAAAIIEEFRDHWYDCKGSGLTVSCYNIVKG